MKTPKPTKQTEAEICCFECDKGILRPIPQNYTTTLKDGRQIIVPDVLMFVCDHCGDSVIGDEGNHCIELFIDHLLNYRPNRRHYPVRPYRNPLGNHSDCL